jgi:Spy/CpxP family protein refolding chaperone
MKYKIIGVISLLAFFLVTTSPFMAYAESSKKGVHHGAGLVEKIFHKFYFLIANQDELNLSDAQVAKIKSTKISAKKDLIKRKAEIDLVSIDIKSILWEDTIDKEKINKLIDQKYELKKEKAKALINAYAELKNILSDEQKKKCKDIIRQSHKIKYRKY